MSEKIDGRPSLQEEGFITEREEKTEGRLKLELLLYFVFIFVPCLGGVLFHYPKFEREWPRYLYVWVGLTVIFFGLAVFFRVRTYLACRKRTELEFEGERIRGEVLAIRAHRERYGRKDGYNVYVAYDYEGKRRRWKSPRYRVNPSKILKEGYECILLKKGHYICLDSDQKICLREKDDRLEYYLGRKNDRDLRTEMETEEEDDEKFYAELIGLMREAGDSEEEIEKNVEDMRASDRWYDAIIADIDSRSDAKKS